MSAGTTRGRPAPQRLQKPIPSPPTVRLRIRRLGCRIGLALAFGRGLGVPRAPFVGEVEQNAFDALLLFDAPIELEREFGHTAQTYAAADVATQERRGTFE